MATFAKPENALKRAEELMNVGQKQAALQALHDLITSKRYRAWQKTLERIMFKYVELCVDMRKGRFAKDGLIQYRIVCQQVNVGSLEEVIKHFLQLSLERAEQAQAQAAEVMLDIEDLEAEKRPEDLMLSYVSGEKGKDRSDRELVTPWFKFLWETYRTVLEILRNNSKLEALYAMTAHRAFQFCLQYKRTTEFRRLCEIIRNHLSNLNKYRDQRDRPDLTLPESFQLYLDTRFEQLKVATELELWQEAFRSIEDIHYLTVLVKKTPKPQMMAIYYAKLTKIFWVSGSHLYHAYAWYKLYSLQKSYNKNLTQKDLQLMAASVLLATLSVMPFDHKHGATHFELEMEKERNLKITNLLGFTADPKRDTREALSRPALLSELVSKGVLTYVSSEVKDLYNLLENELHPLDLASKVEPLLSSLSKVSDKLSSASPVPEVQLEQYKPALEKITTLRVLQQVSQVYQTMNASTLTQMIPFFEFSVVEKLLVDSVKYNFVQGKVDYRKGVVYFGGQDLESDKIRNHLNIMAKRLNKAIGLICPPPIEKPSKQAVPFSELSIIVEKEHKKLLARKVLIEKRKEEQERQMLEMERVEEMKRQKQQKLNEEAEAKRLATESARREEARIRREIEEKELEEARMLLAEAEKRKGKKGRKTAVEGQTKQALMEEALNEQQRERQEQERKLQKLAKTMDHLERAKREEERQLIEAAYEKKLQDDNCFFEQQQQTAIEQSRLQHAADCIEKNRLVQMASDKDKFQSRVMGHRQGEFEKIKREKEERLAQLRLIRKQDREYRRKMEFYSRQEVAKHIRLKEEEEAQKREEEERKRKEEAERLAKLDEIAAKQRQRELEIEERDRQARQVVADKLEPAKPGRYIPRWKVSAGEAAMASTESESERRPVSREEQPPPPLSDEKRPLFAARGLREGDRWGHAEREAATENVPTPLPATNKYQPPRARYEPPRGATDGPTREGASRYEPPRRYEASRPRIDGSGRDNQFSGGDRDRRDDDRSLGSNTWKRGAKPEVPAQ